MKEQPMSKRFDKALVAMDLDGTITQHKSLLTPECEDILGEMLGCYLLLMVCAGSCERVFRQMRKFPIDISGNYGMQLSTAEGDEITILESHSVPVDRDEVLVRAGAVRRELGINNYTGDTIEFHTSGLLTFPILGTTAPLEKKLAFDPDRKIRRRYHHRVQEAFADSTVLIGGTSSFDIVPRPFSKLFAIDRYLQAKGLEHSDVVYFGDDYGLGGNDRVVFDSDIDFIRIHNFRDFPAKARRLLLS
jgi:hydroxymethylpyrimidine pyrophosphatase-like HAD family hydrolase